jgi:inhibitor of KinA sporulation pathway (predicted exonuclease)
MQIMNFVVVDFEWNQALRSDSPVFNHLPIHLRGEIIEIGAVRLNPDLTLGEEFTIDVKPVFFRQIHYQVKKITGFDKERLSHGVSFPEAIKKFREFCGEDVTFITWGNDDQGIFEQNIIIHDLDWDWVSDWLNLQLIYNVQTGGDKNQKSLSEAMEHFGIEQTRTAHDALGDAYNTALVCSKLNMQDGVRNYDDAPRILASRMPKAVRTNVPDGPEPLEHDAFDGFETKAAALSDDRISKLLCPVCKAEMNGVKWISQGDGRYMNIFNCADHDNFLVRVRFKKNMENNTLFLSRLVYSCDDEMLFNYKEKASFVRRRGRGRRMRGTAKR